VLFSNDVEKNNAFLKSGFYSNFKQTPTDLVLLISGAGQWSDYQDFDGIPYCTFCPSLDYFLVIRFSLICLMLFFISFVIQKTLGFRILIIVASSFLAIIYLSSARLAVVYQVLVNLFPHFTIFREPWSKFSHFIPLVLIILIAYSLKLAGQNSFDLRNDKGALWENFLISERIKLQSYHQLYTNNYFWRTIQKQEIDFVEESGGQIHAFGFKWNAAGRNKIPASFLAHYSAQGMVVDKENFRDFIMMQP
jgi:hypothetical protein